LDQRIHHGHYVLWANRIPGPINCGPGKIRSLILFVTLMIIRLFLIIRNSEKFWKKKEWKLIQGTLFFYRPYPADKKSPVSKETGLIISSNFQLTLFF